MAYYRIILSSGEWDILCVRSALCFRTQAQSTQKLPNPRPTAAHVAPWTVDYVDSDSDTDNEVNNNNVLM